ncbi:MAG: acetylornithine deacetylase /succinyl-diaminopimelate desuccinylase [Promethearchaeota archaeon CR_4]|nr:MAG: acetylornithine deacetylase /succinyl-diaminopimelate desuccinylase [Candidatus Lokiarchaeota archaeon CR_4]
MTRDIVAMLRDLVSFDTQNPPGNEEPLVKYCNDFLSGLGFETQLIPVAPNRANLVAMWRPCTSLQDDQRQLVFSGHADTVPIGDPTLWHSPPLEISESDGKLYGRGSCDMKGSIAAFLAVAQNIATGTASIPGISKRPFTIILTADEEMGFRGITALTRQFSVPSVGGVIIGEPTRNIPGIGHKGVAWFQITFHGQAAHASRPDLGKNAILMATKFCERLMADWQASWSPLVHPLLGSPTINIGKITGGIKTNVVPERCDVWVDCRIVPPLEVTDLNHRFEEIARQVTKNVTITPDLVPSLAYSLPLDHPLVQISLKAARRESPQIFPAFTEASHYFHALKLPVVILGPGSIEQCHTTDEYVARSELEAAVGIYERCLKYFGDQIAQA